MGQSLFRSATLHAKAPRTSDGRGGWNGGQSVRLPCRALVVEYTDRQRADGGIPSSERNAIILAATVSQKPQAGDVLVLDGTAWAIGKVKADPANASYEAQATRAPMPSGDTTAATGANILDVMPSTVSAAMGPSLFDDAVFYSATERVADGRGGTVATYAELACKALVVDYSDFQRGVDDIPSKDRRLMMLAATLTSRTPKPGDIVVIDGKAWTLVEVGADPARATFEGQATPGVVPSIGRTGTLAATLGGATLTAIGRATILSVGGGILAGASLAATGTQPIFGALARTLAGASLAGLGSPAIQGGGALALTGATLAGNASPTILGVSAPTLAGAAAVGEGYQRNVGALAITLAGATLFGGAQGSTLGSAAITLAGAGVAADGYQRNAGALTASLAASSLTGSGSPRIVGAGASTLTAATMAGAGYQRNAGAGAFTLAPATIAATGSPVIAGAAAPSLAGATIAGAGYQRNAGALASALTPSTLAGAGSPRILATSATTLAGPTVAGAGYQRNAGAAAITLAGATLFASSSSNVQGSAAITLDHSIAQSNGTITNPGQLSAALVGGTLIADGYQRNAGALARTLASATIAAAGSPRIVAAMAATLTPSTVAADGYQRNAGALASSLTPSAMTGAGSPTILGVGAATLAGPVVDGDGYQRNAGALSIAATGATVAGAGSPRIVAAGAATLAGATVAGNGYQRNAGALTITLVSATLFASSVQVVNGSLAATLTPSTVAADGYQRNAGALAQTMVSATVAGAGSPRIVATLAATPIGASVVGAGYQRNAGAGAVTAAVGSLSATGSPRIVGTVARTMAGATVAGAGYQRNAGALAITAAGATLSAAGTVTAVQNDFVVGNPNNLAGGTWFDVEVGATSLGTAIDGLPQPLIVQSSGADFGRRATTINPSWTNAATYYFKLEFNFGTSNKLYFVIYDGVDESVFTWNGTNIPFQTALAGTISGVTQYTVNGHKELYFQIVAIRSNPTIEIGFGPNSTVGGESITLFDYHVSDTAWEQPTVSGVTGTLATTLAGATVSAAGTVNAVANTGTLATTLAGATVSARAVKSTIAYVGGKTAGIPGSTATNTTVALNSGFNGGVGGTNAGVQAGDLVIVSYGVGVSGAATMTINDPGAVPYVMPNGAQLAGSDNNDAMLRVGYKFMPGTPDANVVLGPTGATANGGAYAIHVYREVNPETPFDVTTTTAVGNNTGRPNPPAITPITRGSVVVVATSSAAGTAVALTFAGATNLQQSLQAATVDGQASLATYAWTSGALDPAASTTGSSTTADSWAALTMALRRA
jgi:hypothetical protein